MAILGFFLGSIGAPLLLFFAYIIFILVTGYEDFEGATAMGLATFVMPASALVGGIALGAIFARLGTRKAITPDSNS